MEPKPVLILASSSRYRHALLQRLRIPFQVVLPSVDETVLPGETPRLLVERLAKEKAAEVSRQFPEMLVIGSDLVGTLDDQLVIGKPVSHSHAVEQLVAASDKSMRFLTGLCVMRAQDGFLAEEVAETVVQFRSLDAQAAQAYLEIEPAYDCAGSIRSEGLGITLLSAIRGSDPTALIGLPLIALSRILRSVGVLPSASSHSSSA